MATITLGGNPIHTNGELPQIGSKALAFTLVKTDLGNASLADFTGSRIVLNIFPSIDTGTCATSVRKFNEKASGLTNGGYGQSYWALCVFPFMLIWKRFKWVNHFLIGLTSVD